MWYKIIGGVEPDSVTKEGNISQCKYRANINGYMQKTLRPRAKREQTAISY